MRIMRVFYIFFLFTFCLISTILSNSWDFSDDDALSKTYPIMNYNQAHPESAWGCIYSKNISTRKEGSRLVAVISWKVSGFAIKKDAGPFSNVAHTFAVDFDDDGYADIVSLRYDGRVVIKRNKANPDAPEFEDIMSYWIDPDNTSVNGEGSLVVDDFDNDGKIDIFFFRSSDGSEKKKAAFFVSDALGNHIRTYGYPKKNDNDFQTGWTVSAMTVWDFDNDGYKDIIYADRKGRVWFWKNNNELGNGRFFNDDGIYKLFEDPDIGSSSKDGAAVLDVSDINQDGIPDIIAGQVDKRGIFIYLGKEENNNIVYDPSEKLTLVKLDGDLGPLATVDTSVSLNSKNPKDLPSFAPTVIKVTDMDKDGILDIFVGTDAWRQGRNFGGSVYLFKGKDLSPTGVPNFVSIELVHGNYSSSGETPYDFDAGTVGDINNDGMSDLVVADGNHSGDFFMIRPELINEYNEGIGFMISDYLTNVVNFKTPDGNVVTGIPRQYIPDNFVKAVEIEIEFSQAWSGYFDLRYSKRGIRNPNLVNPDNFPLMLDASTMQPMEEWKLVPSSKTFKARVVFDTPTPDPQILFCMKRFDENKAPHITKITYKIWTEPSRVIIKGYNWMKGE